MGASPPAASSSFARSRPRPPSSASAAATRSDIPRPRSSIGTAESGRTYSAPIRTGPSAMSTDGYVVDIQHIHRTEDVSPETWSTARARRAGGAGTAMMPKTPDKAKTGRSEATKARRDERTNAKHETQNVIMTTKCTNRPTGRCAARSTDTSSDRLCIRVHRELGPGLLERIYRSAVSIELQFEGMIRSRSRRLSRPVPRTTHCASSGWTLSWRARFFLK